LLPLRGSSSQTIERRILAMMGQRAIRIVAAVLVLMVCLTLVAGVDIVFGRQVWSDWIIALSVVFDDELFVCEAAR
jgi:hypothetical protein